MTVARRALSPPEPGVGVHGPPARRAARRRSTVWPVLGGLAVLALACSFLLPRGPEVVQQGRAPVGDLGRDTQGPAGWTQVFVDDFDTPDRPDSTGSMGQGRWWGYPAGTPVTNSTNGVYDPARVVRVADGQLTMTGTADASTAYGAVMAPQVDAAQTYGRYDVRYRYTRTDITGFKSVWMLWPDSNDWGDGEIDFAEYREDTSSKVSAAVHQACGLTPCTFSAHDVAIDPLGWHTATAIWSPGKVTTYIDGHELTSADHGVPDKPMHLLLQLEASSSGVTAAPGTTVGVDVDWVTVYRRN